MDDSERAFSRVSRFGLGTDLGLTSSVTFMLPFLPSEGSLGRGLSNRPFLLGTERLSPIGAIDSSHPSMSTAGTACGAWGAGVLDGDRVWWGRVCFSCARDCFTPGSRGGVAHPSPQAPRSTESELNLRNTFDFVCDFGEM